MALGDLVFKIIADPSGVKTGTAEASAHFTQWSKTVAKLPGVDALREYTREYKTFVAGVAAFGAVAVAGRVIDGIKSLYSTAKHAAAAFSEAAKEANSYAVRLGVASQQMFLLQAAGKNMAFEDVGKLILRWNLAVADSKKTGLFDKLGLDRVAIEGKNALEVVRNLVGALDGKGRPEQFAALRDLFKLRPDALMGFTGLLEGGLAGFDKRVDFARKYGLIPDQEALDTEKRRAGYAKIRDAVDKGANYKLGQAASGALEGWDQFKTAFKLALADTWKDGFRGLLAVTGDHLEKFQSHEFRAQARAQVEAKEAAEKAEEDAKARADKVKPLEDKYGKSLRERWEEQMDLAGDLSDVSPRARKMAELKEQMAKAREEYVKADNERLYLVAEGDTADPKKVKANKARMEAAEAQVNDLKKQRERAGSLTDESARDRAMKALHDGVMGGDSPLQTYRKRIDEIKDACDLGIISLDEWGKEAKKAWQAANTAYGAGPTPLERFADRAKEIKEGLAMGTSYDRAIANAFKGLGGGLRESSLSGAVDARSQEGVSSLARWTTGFDKPLSIQERVSQVLEEQKEIERQQLEEARATREALEALGVI